MPLKIIFMGTPNFSVPILKSIHNSQHEVIGIYTQSPKKKNRGQKISISPVHEFALTNKIDVRYPEILDSSEEVEYISSLNPNLIVVVAYGKIIPKKLLNFNKLKFINVHASLLPKWRGAAPIHRSIMNLDKETGISIMQITPKLDTGPVLMKKKIKILKNSNFNDLSNQLSLLGSKMIIESLQLIEDGKANFLPQNENEATYAKKISKAEAKIDWRDKAEKIVAKINALHLNPGSWFDLNGSRIKVLKAIEIKAKGDPGEVLDNNLSIACFENAIKILKLKKEGKKSMDANEFLKGFRIIKGTKLE